MDGWAPIKVKRFSGERRESYEWRSAKIKEIIEGFRRGRFAGPVAEAMELTLVKLQTPTGKNYAAQASEAA